jgi:hypothetical protein
MSERALVIEMEAVPKADVGYAHDLVIQYLVGIRERNLKVPKEILGNGLDFVSSMFPNVTPGEEPSVSVAVWSNDFEVALRFKGLDYVASKLLHLGTLMPSSHWHRIHVRELIRPSWALGKRIL